MIMACEGPVDSERFPDSPPPLELSAGEYLTFRGKSEHVVFRVESTVTDDRGATLAVGYVEYVDHRTNDVPDGMRRVSKPSLVGIAPDSMSDGSVRFRKPSVELSPTGEPVVKWPIYSLENVFEFTGVSKLDTQGNNSDWPL